MTGKCSTCSAPLLELPDYVANPPNGYALALAARKDAPNTEVVERDGIVDPYRTALHRQRQAHR